VQADVFTGLFEREQFMLWQFPELSIAECVSMGIPRGTAARICSEAKKYMSE
jgi:hypothetical protein